MQKKGIPIGELNILIAAHAKALGYTLMTYFVMMFGNLWLNIVVPVLAILASALYVILEYAEKGFSPSRLSI